MVRAHMRLQIRRLVGEIPDHRFWRSSLDEPLTLSQMVEKFLAWNSCNTKI